MMANLRFWDKVIANKTVIRFANHMIAITIRELLGFLAVT